MKYKTYNQIIPQDKRENINNKILYTIDNNLCEQYGITNEVIYNSYTGIGGLHNLKFKDYNSFHSYTKAKQEIENGQFYTGSKEAEYLINILGIPEDETVLDLTCGIGSMFNYLPNEANTYGNEIDIKSVKVARKLYPLANISHGDMREYYPNILFDNIIGNPPFNLRMKYNGSEMYSQMVYIKHCHKLLKTGGIMALIVPKSFLDDEFSNKSDIDYMNDKFNFIGQVLLKKDAFKYLGVDNFQTKIILFSKKTDYIPSKEYYNDFIQGSSQYIYDNYIKNIRYLQSKFKSSITLENLRQYNNKDKEFNEKVKKLLFDIKRTKSTKIKYQECYNYFQQYYNQKKPDSLSVKEWMDLRITKKKVIKKLKNVLSNQHLKENDTINLVKTNYHLKLKGYSEKSNLYLSKNKNSKISINDLVLNGYNFEDNKYKKLINRKKKYYENQSIDFDEMNIDENIEKWLKDTYLYDNENNIEIYLNTTQQTIVNKMLQKRYGYIQSSQGTGKTLMSIIYSLYRKENSFTRNTLVVAPSIALNGTWSVTLDNHNLSYTIIRNKSDIDHIKPNDYILVTFNMMCKYKKHIKKYLKRISNKYCLIVDEADSICNITSKRTNATIGCCNKAKYKLLLSGTMTKNNIIESYTQLNLLYNSSINFLSENKEIYKEDADTKELKSINNDNYNKPIPQYRKGLELFKESFNPQKITVFGVGKNTQDIYNSEYLKKIINKTIITKTFEDVVGKKIYTIKQHIVRFNSHEKELYNKAINDFYSMKYLFTSTGNPRKDKYLEIIQQLNLLLNICNHPQSYNEYNSNELPNKYKKVLELINKWDGEYVAIGCRTLKEVDNYRSLISHNTKRPLFIITGATSMTERKNIIKQLKETQNGVLLSTQQSLSSSISINFVNKVICTALSWNWGTLSQYFFRFIRYNSTDFKEVHFITYGNSLESNLLSLIASKENLNNFMKNQDIENNELMEELGIDFDLLSMILTKEKDENNKSYIRWGEQEIL